MAVPAGHDWTCSIKCCISLIASWYSWSKKSRSHVFQSVRLKTAPHFRERLQGVGGGIFTTVLICRCDTTFITPSFWDTWGSGTRRGMRLCYREGMGPRALSTPPARVYADELCCRTQTERNIKDRPVYSCVLSKCSWPPSKSPHLKWKLCSRTLTGRKGLFWSTGQILKSNELRNFFKASLRPLSLHEHVDGFSSAHELCLDSLLAVSMQ